MSCAGNACGSNTLDYLVVAGGGGGGAYNGGGGGAGGFRVSNSAGCVPAPTMSPLIAPPVFTVPDVPTPLAPGPGPPPPPPPDPPLPFEPKPPGILGELSVPPPPPPEKYLVKLVGPGVP